MSLLKTPGARAPEIYCVLSFSAILIAKSICVVHHKREFALFYRKYFDVLGAGARNPHAHLNHRGKTSQAQQSTKITLSNSREFAKDKAPVTAVIIIIISARGRR